MMTGADIETLRQEEAALNARLPCLSLSDPEARAEAREIRERLAEITTAKLELAKAAAAEAERHEQSLRRRQRRAA